MRIQYNQILRYEESQRGGDTLRAFEKLKQLIDDKGITYTFISNKTGIPVNTISRKLPADEMISICKATGIDLNDFVEENRIA